MTTFFLDPESGNDGNDGTTFANRWKTFTSGATAARTAPGDTIKIIGSPAAVSTGTTASWSINSTAVTFGSTLNATVDSCDSGWTGVTNSTVTHATDRQLGTACMQAVVAAAFTTGKAAFHATGTLNLSGYQQVCFWAKSTVALSASQASVRLCTDTIGATSVHTCTLGAMPANVWVPVVVDLATNLNSAIASVALYVDSDFGAVTLKIDHIFVSKASSGNDAITLHSMIAFNSSGPFYHVRAVSGTTCELESNITATAGVGRGSHANSSASTLYKRETIKGTMLSSGSSNTVQEAGTNGSLITYSGGWDRSAMTTQNLVTYWDGLTVAAQGIVCSQQYIKFEKLVMTRWDYGFNVTGANCQFVDIGTACTTTYGMYLTGDSQSMTGTNTFTHCAAYGFNYQANGSSLSMDCYSNNTYGANLALCYGNTFDLYGINNGTGFLVGGSYNSFPNFEVASSGSAGLNLSNGASYNTFTNVSLTGSFGQISTSGANKGNKIYGGVISSSGPVEVITSTGGELFLNSVDWTVSANPEINFGPMPVPFESRVYFRNYDNTAGTHKVFMPGGYYASTTATRHTASGLAWELRPTNTTQRNAYMPLACPIGKVFCSANSQVTVTAWLRRSNTGITGKLVAIGTYLAGIATNVTASMTASADTWEQLSIQFTPTEAGLVELEAHAYGGTTYSVFVDDLAVSQ